MKVYLLLGSNIEPRIEFIEKAITSITKEVGVVFVKSSLYETAAWGKEDQADFLNQAIGVETALAPENLLEILKKIEVDTGRKHRQIWAEREIDIDILIIENIVFKSPNLEVPHPRLHQRNFALQPLNEIAPNVVHPTFNKSVSTLFAESADSKRVYKVF